MPQKIGKEATAILDFTIDLTNLLQTTEIINTSNWTVPTGITQVTATNDNTMATIWLSGGTLNAVYELINTVVTNSVPARTFVNRLYIPIVKK
jgi:hypothetical protein